MFFVKPNRPSLNFDGIHFAVSFDGPTQPNSEAEILLYGIKNNDIKIIDSNILSANLIARLERKNKDRGFIPVSYGEEKIVPDFPLIFRFQIPENSGNKKVWFNLYSNSARDQLLFSQKISIKPDRTLILTPPSTQPACGKSLSFNFHSFNLKTLAPEYRMPIRIKMQSPFNLFTLNKVLNTDINGKAIFQTLMHAHAAPGLYNFFINFANRKISASISVDGSSVSNSANQLKARQLPSKIIAMPEYKIDFLANRKFLFSSLKAEKDMLNFNFACSGSSFRTIEIWQEQQLIDQSYLPIENGRSTYPLPRKINLKKPLKVKLWMLKDNKIEVDTRIIVISPDKTFANLLKNIKTRINGITRFPEKQFLTNFANENSHIYSNSMDKKQVSTSLPAFYKISSTKEQNIIADYKSRKSKRLDYFTKTDVNYNFASRFFVVKNEISLAGYHFNNLFIHLSPVTFLQNFIASLPDNKADISYLLSEAEARLLLMNYLNLSQQKQQIKLLESLVTPLSEVALIINEKKSFHKKIKHRLYKTLGHFKNYVHIPAELKSRINRIRETIPALGPLKNILDHKLELSELNRYLQSSGKIFINKNKGSFQLNLTGNLIKQVNQSELNSKNRIVKLTNSRVTPIIIEISRAGKEDDKVIH
ncbi:MAG: hypothetical protein ACQETH_17340 [Candidatus Rifleibacteriota bacterium]